MIEQLEVRTDGFIKEIILPIIISVVTGIGASYMATKITLAIIETRLAYVEGDVISLKAVITSVNENQRHLAKTNEQLRGLDRRMIGVENAIILLGDRTDDRYKRSEAEKDLALLHNKIEALRKDLNKQ